MNKKMISLLFFSISLLSSGDYIWAMEKNNIDEKEEPEVKEYQPQIRSMKSLKEICAQATIDSLVEESFKKIPVELGEYVEKKAQELPYFGNTSLHEAENAHDVIAFLALKVNPNVKNADLQTAINSLISLKRHDAALALLNLGGDNLDVSSPDIFGSSPLLNTIKKGYFDLGLKIINLLRKNNELSTINIPNAVGQTALLLAIQFKPDLVEPLLDAGADVNIEDQNGNNALLYTTQFNPGLIKLVVAAGADINFVDEDGYTALMDIARSHPELIKLFVNAGAKPNLVNQDGSTALMYAAQHNLKAVQPLIDAGADITIVNKNRETALTIAQQHNPDAVPLLLKAASK